jgi:hypothetical protein
MTGPVAHVGKASVPTVGDGLPDLGGWEQFKNLMQPAMMADPFRPQDDVMRELAWYSGTVEGAKVIAWLRSITDGAPYPQHLGNIEQTALAAAKHQGRCMPGGMISHAIAEGTRLRALKG